MKKKLKIDTTVKYWHASKVCQNWDANLWNAINIGEKGLIKIASVHDLDKIRLGRGIPPLES